MSWYVKLPNGEKARVSKDLHDYVRDLQDELNAALIEAGKDGGEDGGDSPGPCEIKTE
ncbi:MAG: hypothetical protein GY854_19770 [Deltaproteobacteria bacterium]|nr:hypothetical protein [Deltaproteobacteria bacterium]